ncbi:MAG: Panacea domain-containing protein [Terracidiphilus sp.]
MWEKPEISLASRRQTIEDVDQELKRRGFEPVFEKDEMLNFRANGEKVVNMIAYFAGQCTDATKMKISKLMYFADKAHLNRFGRPISGDTYIRMKLGPVPSMGLNLMRHTTYFENVSELFDELIEVKGNEVRPLKGFNREIFSRSDISVMDETISQLGDVHALRLSDLSHDESAWKKADMNRKIDFELLFDETAEGQQMLGLLLEDSRDNASLQEATYSADVR